ncbi:MAG: LacI family DNA-binding transcriptional regulator, partial [Aggregatilineales bacterium]
MKKRASVTQKQIAQRAGVSQTVVSLALNRSSAVILSDITRQRVLDVAKEMGYVPQAAAKSLVQGHSTNIGLVLVQPHYQVFRDPYIPNVMTGLSEIVRENSYRLIVEHITHLDDLSIIRDMLKSGEVAGLILSNFHWAEEIATPLIEEKYPIVLTDTYDKHNYHSASINHVDGVRSVVTHMVEQGHQRIACIAYGPADHLHVTRRLQIFQDVLQEVGIAFNPSLIRYGEYDPESAYTQMQWLLTETSPPTAVFGMNDMMAIGAMRAILDAGLRIPEDIAVVGYDEMRFAPFTNPALTTVRAPEVKLG